jgi:hypothetical protein
MADQPNYSIVVSQRSTHHLTACSAREGATLRTWYGTACGKTLTNPAPAEARRWADIRPGLGKCKACEKVATEHGL